MTRVHAGDGSMLAEYAHERRLYLPSSAIPTAGETGLHLGRGQEFLHAINGIDPEGMVRAAMVLVQGNKHVQGASTITQQVAKNFLLTNERSFDRKIKEALLVDAHRAGLFQGAHPRALPQRNLSRPRQLRHRRRRPELFRQVGVTN